MWGYVIGIISVAEGSEAHSIAGMRLEGGRISGCYNKNGINSKMFSIDIVLLIEISVKNSTALKAIITT